MNDLTFLTAIARSSVMKYNPSESGIEGTIYVDYLNKIGYIWSVTDSSYVEVFNSNIPSGLRFMGLYDEVTNTPNITMIEKSVGDFWIVSDVTTNSQSLIGDWIIWNGTSLCTLRNNRSISSTDIVENDFEVSKFDCTYLVDTSSGDVNITIPNSLDDNKNTTLNFIKMTSDNNFVKVTLHKNSKEYKISKINETLGFISSGDISYDWVLFNDGRKSEPVKSIEIVNGTNNWKIVPSDNELLFQRYLNNEPYTVFRISNQINCNKIILDKPSGKFGFKDVGGTVHTLIKPARDVLGVCIGNASGSANVVNNGSFSNIIFNNNIEWYTVNGSTSESISGTIFQYQFTSDVIQDIISAKISLTNVIEGTRLRFIIRDMSGNVLEENVSQFDFESSDIRGGNTVVNGENTINLLEGVTLPSNYTFTLIMYFSNRVDLLGSTISLNDGLDVRFIPCLSMGRYLGKMYDVLHDGNIKAKLDGLKLDKRIDGSSIYNPIFETNTNLTLLKCHVNHTILFTHTSGSRLCTILDDSLFNNGDMITIKTQDGVVYFYPDVIQPHRCVVYQKISSLTWELVAEHDYRDMGQCKFYYGLNQDGSLTFNNVKDNLSEYGYLYDWKIDVNTLSIHTDSIGDYYLYLLLPSTFLPTQPEMIMIHSGVLHGTRYILFRSNFPINITSLQSNIQVMIT